jgi:DNA-binding XRE family transcriptional regulator
MGYGNVLLRSEGRQVSGREGRLLREGARLSLRDIAEAIGVSHSAVAHWESGRRSPRGAVAERYAAFLRLLRERQNPSATGGPYKSASPAVRARGSRGFDQREKPTEHPR